MTIDIGLPDPTTAPPWLGTSVAANPREVAQWLVVTSDANRQWWFDRHKQSADQAEHCWMHDHDARLARLQKQLHDARERIDWLERNYSTSSPTCAS